MIQNIQPNIFSSAWTPRLPKSGDFIIGFEQINVYVKENDRFYTYDEVPHDREFIFLFMINQIAVFETDLTDITQPQSLQIFRKRGSSTFQFTGVTAWHLHDWRHHNQYCGHCGTRMIQRTSERAMECPNCGNIVYPRINPAVIVGLINDHGQLLVTHYQPTHHPGAGMALIAGYAEIGETIEETVVREVKEETNLEATQITYFTSQPWAFSQSLLFGFWARVSGDTPIKLDEQELSDATWISREELSPQENPISLTATMIEMFRKGLTPFE